MKTLAAVICCVAVCATLTVCGLDYAYMLGHTVAYRTGYDTGYKEGKAVGHVVVAQPDLREACVKWWSNSDSLMEARTRLCSKH